MIDHILLFYFVLSCIIGAVSAAVYADWVEADEFRRSLFTDDGEHISFRERVAVTGLLSLGWPIVVWSFLRSLWRN